MTVKTTSRQAAAGATALAGTLGRFAQFAGLAGKPKAADMPANTGDVDEIEDKIDDVEDKVEDLEDKVDDLEDEVDDKKDDDEPADDEPGDDKPAEQAAFRRGRAAGRKAERVRAGAILAAPAAAENKMLAMHLAFDGSLSANAAIGMLKASAAGMPAPAAAGSRLDARMSGSRQIAVGTGGPAGPDRNTPEGASAFCIAAAAKARGQKGT